MKLLTYEAAPGAGARVGMLSKDGNHITPLAAEDMVSLIAAGAIPATAGNVVPFAFVRLLAPIPRPRKNVFCVGWNYVEHFEEGKAARPHVQEMPDFPTFFTKAPTAVNGPYDRIPYDGRISEKLDWEVELGVIIGRGGKNIAEADAMNHVFGYTVINDVSWRDIQRRHGQQWFKGKSLDGTCPMGPWIVTRDEVKPENLRIRCSVNGVVKQDANTSQMYFKIPRIISELSQGMTLEPGDVIATGTPSGVGHSRTPPEFMKPGDVLETEIEGIGSLKNTIGS
jgi:2-keto-4-pentenoate hydratase/2-oxohepta-3-ene-1,7-dioic acid hydratase in catechol pathway